MIYLNLVKEWRQHKLHFELCPYCGSKLIGKEIWNEGNYGMAISEEGYRKMIYFSHLGLV